MNQPHPKNICYIGSLSIEESTAGPIQLYRLLQDHPASQLLVFHEQEASERSFKKLDGVRYEKLPTRFKRGTFRARMHHPRLFKLMLKLIVDKQAKHVIAKLGDFKPEAILTIHERLTWLTAKKVAQTLKIPLHTIFHDEWFRNIPMHKNLKPFFEEEFAQIYSLSQSRLCISPFMEEYYQNLTGGVKGSTLWPMQSKESSNKPFSQESSLKFGETIHCAYAGNIFHAGYWDQIRTLAMALKKVGGDLKIFGPIDRGSFSGASLPDNVQLVGFVDNLNAELEKQANLLFLPMSFEEHERPNQTISYPSKLTEYTLSSLPIYTCGPSYCSAIRWATENEDVALATTNSTIESMAADLTRLKSAKFRLKLARTAYEFGQNNFRHDKVTSEFANRLACK